MAAFNAQAGLSDLATVFARSGAMAATQVMARTASLGLLLWSDLLAASAASARPISPWGAPEDALKLAFDLSPMSWMLRERPQASIWPAPAGAWSPVAGWAAWSRAWGLPAAATTGQAAVPATIGATAARGGYASYRSAGGHASTQVIMG